MIFGIGYVRDLSLSFDLLTCVTFSRRRICPDITVAECEMWLTVSRMLWAFDMSEVPGEPINLEEYDGLSGRSPMPFLITLKPRHVEVEKVLKRETERWNI